MDDLNVEDFINEEEDVILQYIKGRPTPEQIERELYGEED